MSTFELYFGLGKDHILEFAGYDHIIFIIALCAVYQLRDWKKVLILVTAFTIGHSITLALATLSIIHVHQELVEFLIPITILITALTNIFRSENNLTDGNIHINYLFALFFGLIHGMGFSNYLRSILGQQQNILTPLFAFNVGLEFGQIVVVLIVLLISYVLVSFLTVSRRDWRIVTTAIIAGIALVLAQERIFW